MKKAVWKNKSNNQLCITIPKNSGLREGDIVELKRSKINCIAYSGVVADLFHYGHLHSLLFAKSISDYNIVGVITDEAVEQYRAKPIANLQERKAVLENLSCIDRVIIQRSRDHTENLQKIHEEFPEAEIILVHGDDLQDVPGEKFVKSIGGRVVRHPYYSKLSTFKIVNKMGEMKDKFKDMIDLAAYIQESNKTGWESQNKTIISSKADTLQVLQPLLVKSKIEKLFSFTISDWKNKKLEIMETIKKEFSPNPVVVRSSAVKEDTYENSMAGHFESVLGVNPLHNIEIQSAVERVINSYKKKDAETSFNQILIQEQTPNIIISGVVLTRTLEKNAPYYVINYDDKTGKSDSVTAGKENKTITVSRFATTFPERFVKLLQAIQELEERIPNIPLDIEFAINRKKEVIIFQVRPMAANRYKPKYDQEVQEKTTQYKKEIRILSARQKHLAGEITYFGDMPDWNPAEIIGDNPNHLDYSLYDFLITNSAWHEARTSQGYYNVNPAKLVELFGNKPYVNVRNTFNSFTPASISPTLREKLVTFYLNKLEKKPHLQDKVEFEICFTCYDLSFKERERELLENGFQEQEIEQLKDALVNLTNNLVLNSLEDITKDLGTIEGMGEFRKVIEKKVKIEPHDPRELINFAKILLDECRKKGTIQFSKLARLAFIGKIILKSLAERKVVDNIFCERLLNSITTVATRINKDFKKLIQGEKSKEEFIKEYYHLRPGTYNITSLRYDSHPDLINTINLNIHEEEKSTFQLDDPTATIVTQAFQQEGLQFDARHFINFVRTSLEARELSKFEFTKNLSDALELIAKAGEEMGFTRKEISQLDLDTIFKSTTSNVHEISRQWKEIIKAKEIERSVQEQLVLPAIIFSEQDFDVIEHYQAKPNFITQKKIEGTIINFEQISEKEIPQVEGNIVVLENGDPGYDWIFTRNPAGLITKYGGVASHMAIRCAEFGLPAAIGCGDTIFNQVKTAEKVILDCKNSSITPLVK